MKTNKNNDWYIKGIKEQSRNVLIAFKDDFFPMIRDYVLKNSGTFEDAEDVFCDAIEAIYRKIQEEEFVLTCKLSTFLFTVCKNKWLTKLRGKKYTSTVTIDDPILYKEARELDRPMEETEEYKLMREKFQTLPEDCQKVLDLSWYSDKSGKEIAKDMGWTHGYLRKRKSKCREKLIDLVKTDPRFLELKGA